VPFTLRNLKEDLEDVGSRFDGVPSLGEAQRDDVEGQRDWWADKRQV
jgi:hypothetical protein